MTSNNLLDSGLDSLMSDNSIFNVVLNCWGSSSIRMMGLSNNCWGMCNWGSNNSTTCITNSSTCIANSSRGSSNSSNWGSSNKPMGIISVSLRHGSPKGTSHKGTSDQSVHVSVALFRRDSPC